ncbi:MAG TPA: proline racemase family protein [Acidimicrobiia bacterium]|nr:proline racemase family protein [Acidimicrobiia bacterium]
MDLAKATVWEPPDEWVRLTVVDSHTGGEPFRVVVEGLPEIPGDTVLERRRHAMENLDDLRRALMWEPRGHADMYGGWVGHPVADGSDMSVLFTHNEGFSTMCGHGIIALAKVVIDTGIVPAEIGERHLAIDTPAGTISSTSSVTHQGVSATTFRNVPSFALVIDGEVQVPGFGLVRYDLGFGGAFYAIVDASSVGLNLDDASTLIRAGREIKGAVSSAVDIAHPEHDDLGFLYGVIFTGSPLDPASHSRNVCVFADGEVDRSPTGTGVSTRLALLHARGEIDVGEAVVIESIVGSRFAGRIAATTTSGPHPAIIPEVTGSAHIVGRTEVWIDPSDPLPPFLIRS